MWIGWVWTGDRWLDVCQGRTMSSCSKRLQVEAQARCIRRNTHRALTGGSRPTWTPSEACQEGPAAPQGHAVEVQNPEGG